MSAREELDAYLNSQTSTTPATTGAGGDARAELDAYLGRSSDRISTPEPENNTLQDIASVGQIAAEAVSFGVIGDEVAAAGRAAIDWMLEDEGDFADNYAMYLKDSREIESNFRKENPGTSLGIDIAGGLMGGVKIAGALGNAPTRMGNVFRQGAAGGAEGAVRGFSEGEDVADRFVNAAIYGTGGLVLGGGVGGIMRGADDIKMPKPGRKASTEVDSLAGKEGFTSKEKMLQEKKWYNNTIGYFADDLKTRGSKLVSPRFGVLMNRAEGDKMKSVAGIVDHVENQGAGLRQLDKFFHSKAGEQARLLIVNANAKVGPSGKEITEPMREAMLTRAEAIISQADPSLGKTFGSMKQVVRNLAQDDIVNVATKGYFPRRASTKAIKMANKTKTRFFGVGRNRLDPFKKTSSNVDSDRPWISKDQLDLYRAPTAAFMDYLEEASTINAVVKHFQLDDILYPGAKKFTLDSKGEPLESSLKALQKGLSSRLKAQGASESVQENASALIDSFVQMSRQGPKQWLQGLRTATSVALLGTPENAVLQFGDSGVAAYQSGLRNAMMSLPKGLVSMVATDTDKIAKKGFDNFVRAPDVGVTRQFLGEMKKEGEHPVTMLLDTVGDKIMSSVGVRKVNRLGQEVAMNAAWRRARSLANSPQLAKDLRGWAPQEIKALRNDLADGERSDLVMSYLFSKLTDIQPVSATALPQAYADHPNGRVFYAMKTYMVKQSQILRDDVFHKFMEAERRGLGTPEGQALAKEAATSAGRYVAIVAGLNAFVDEKRKVPRTGEDNYDPVASTARQVVANVSGGVIDTKASDYGRSTAEGMIPPAVQGPAMILDGMLDGDPEAVKKAVVHYGPGLRQIQWFLDLMEGGDD